MLFCCFVWIIDGFLWQKDIKASKVHSRIIIVPAKDYIKYEKCAEVYVKRTEGGCENFLNLVVEHGIDALYCNGKPNKDRILISTDDLSDVDTSEEEEEEEDTTKTKTKTKTKSSRKTKKSPKSPKSKTKTKSKSKSNSTSKRLDKLEGNLSKLANSVNGHLRK